MKFETFPEACELFAYGEVEDYTLNVVSPSTKPIISNDQLQLAAYFELGKVDLTWFNNTGYKNDLFVIEKSTNGIDFEPINEKLSLTSKASEMYRELDPSPQIGKNYYRVKLIMNDQTTIFSNVKEVDLNQNPLDVSIFPNPAENRIFISMKELEGKKSDFKIIDRFGKMMYSQSFESLPGEPVKVDLTDFVSGVYFIKINSEGRRSITKRLIVVNEN